MSSSYSQQSLFYPGVYVLDASSITRRLAICTSTPTPSCRMRSNCGRRKHHLSFSLFSLIFSQSLSVLTYPELSPMLRLFLSSSPVLVGLGFDDVVGSRGGGGFINPIEGSVSVSLSPSDTFSASVAFSLCFISSESSAALAERSSATNQLIDHHRPPHNTDNTTKWTLYVARRRQSSRNCRQAKEAFVATSSVDVGPGMKTLFQSSSKKDAISGCRRVRKDGSKKLVSLF